MNSNDCCCIYSSYDASVSYGKDYGYYSYNHFYNLSCITYYFTYLNTNYFLFNK